MLYFRLLISLNTFWRFIKYFTTCCLHYSITKIAKTSWLDTHFTLYERVYTNKQTLLYFLKISVLFCTLTMVLAHVVWIIPLQRSQSRWGRRRVGCQARRKMQGHGYSFIPLTWQICLPLFVCTRVGRYEGRIAHLPHESNPYFVYPYYIRGLGGRLQVT